MKKNKVDMYKKGYQTGEFNKKQLTNFYKIGYLYCDNVLFEQEYIDIENDQGIVDKELSKIKMYGTIEAWVNKKNMKQPDKFEILFHEFRNEIKNEFKNMDNKFTKAIETLDNKFTNAIGEIKTEIKNMDIKFTNAIDEIKTEIKEIKNDIVNIKNDIVDIKKDIEDIKSCPTIKKELEMLEK